MKTPLRIALPLLALAGGAILRMYDVETPTVHADGGISLKE